MFAAQPLGLAMLAGTTSQALAKAKQKAVRYQDEPKKGRNCHGCRHFQEPKGCKLVEGEISPNISFWFGLRPKPKANIRCEKLVYPSLQTTLTKLNIYKNS
jgi:hypothetical protein